MGVFTKLLNPDYQFHNFMIVNNPHNINNLNNKLWVFMGVFQGLILAPWLLGLSKNTG